MATQPTNNAVPSESPRDLKFNAGKIDEYVNSMGWTYTDRFGKKHYTIEGNNYLAQQAMASFGYVILTGKTFITGATINHPNEVLLNTADSEYYKWTGSFAAGGKLVPQNSTPGNTGGIGPGVWVGVGDASLRAALKSSSDDTGDALITVKQPFTGSKNTTVHQKMREIVAINDGSSSGAEPDGVTDCSPSLSGLVATGNPVIRFPFIPAASNIYYFSSFDPDSLQGVTLDVDLGVKLSVPNDYLVSKQTSLNIKFSRATKFIFRSLKTEYTVMPGNNEVYAEKDSFLESSDFDSSVVKNIVVTSTVTPVKISWPTSDTWVSDSFQDVGADYGQFTVASGDDNFRFGAISIVPGQEISSHMYISGNPRICAIVRHTNGYSGVYASTLQSGATVFAFDKVIGSSGTSSQVLYPMLTDHLSYSPINCEWKIRVNGFNSYDVLFNGFVVISAKTTGFIIDAGFGGFFSNGATSSSVRFINPVKIIDSPKTKNSFSSVLVFGDSISSNRADCWPHYLQKELEFAEGVRAWKINNQAVPGATSADQLARMQITGVADATVVVIAVGTNDAQGQISPDTFKTNLSAMVDYCKNAGVHVVVAKFGLWYPQALVGAGIGQDTGNYQFAARYRSIVARVCAEKSVKMVDLQELEGPLTAYYVNPSLAVNMVGDGDSVAHDNIHPTTMATKLIARKIARSIMGELTMSTGLFALGISSIAATNGWVINSSDRPVLMDISKDGVVNLSGIIFRGSASFSDGTTIMQAPKNMAPARNIEFAVSGTNTGIRLIALPNGEIKVYGATSSTQYISVGGVSWMINY